MNQLHRKRLLKELCTLGIGGPADYFCEVNSVEKMQEVIRYCDEEKLRFLILGKGSNCLFDDRGYKGVVILNKIDFCDQKEPGLFHVGGGFSFSLLGAKTARQGWEGLEFASGIPGTVGGAVFMNAGANGTETYESLISVDFVDQHGELQILRKDDLDFQYRYSSFHKKRGAIVGATFQLRHSPEAREKQLKIIEYRTETQPYGDKSAGCIFRNPDQGHAGALIEQCGLKGLKIGGAEVSPKHANFIVNREEGTSQDFLNLISEVQKQVKEKTGSHLESEVRVIPYQEDEY